MCVNLSLPNGHRCPIHLKGSRALINTTAIEAGVTVEETKAAFKALRKEGRNLPDPTPEQVKAWTESQRIKAKFNTALSNYQSTIAQRQWTQAAEEPTDGATFHAWRNTMSEIVRRGKSKVLALGLVATISVGVGACGNASNQPIPEIPEPSPSVTEALETMPYNLVTENHERLGIGSDTSITRSFPDGTPYNPTTVDANSPALQLENVGIQEGESEEALYAKYSKEDVQDAIIYFSQFTVKDIYDSEASYNPTDEESLKHYNEIKPQLTESLQSHFDNTENYRVFTNMKLKVAAEAGVTFNQGSNGENFAVVDMEVGNVHVDSATGNLMMTVRVVSDYSMSIKTPDGSDTDHMAYRAVHDRAFSLNKSDDGDWAIAGIWGSEDGLYQKVWKESEIQNSSDNGKSITPEDVFEPVEDVPLLKP